MVRRSSGGPPTPGAHINDVFPCTVARRQAFLWPNIRKRELKLAHAEGVVAIDPASWFCTPYRCPVIADNMLIFRDSQHIMPEWSAFLAPLLEGRLVPAISEPPPSGSST